MCNILHILDILGVLQKGKRPLIAAVIGNSDTSVTFRLKGKGRVKCTYYEGGIKKYKFADLPAYNPSFPPVIITMTGDAGSVISVQGIVESADVSVGSGETLHELWVRYNNELKEVYAYTIGLDKFGTEKCPALQDLTLSQNNLTGFTPDSWKSLRIVDLGDNPLTELPLDGVQDGTMIYLDNCPLQTDEASQLAFVATLPTVGNATIEFVAPAYASVNTAAAAKGWNINYV